MTMVNTNSTMAPMNGTRATDHAWRERLPAEVPVVGRAREATRRSTARSAEQQACACDAGTGHELAATERTTLRRLARRLRRLLERVFLFHGASLRGKPYGDCSEQSEARPYTRLARIVQSFLEIVPNRDLERLAVISSAIVIPIPLTGGGDAGSVRPAHCSEQLEGTSWPPSPRSASTCRR